MDQLLIQIKAQIEIVKYKKPLANGRTQSIAPENPENPYDYYGETYANVDANYNFADYYEANTDQSYEVCDGYITSITSYLATQNIFINNYSLDAIEQKQADLDTYGIDYTLNQAYNEGRISYSTWQLLSAYYVYHQSGEIDASTFNDIAIIFENNIVESEILSGFEAEQTLSLISIIKYDNAIYCENYASRRICRARAILGFILGGIYGGPGGAFVGAALLFFGCMLEFSN